MQTPRFLVFLVLLSITAGCAPSTDTSTAYRPTATIKDIMDAVIDPSADEVWESVSTVVDIEGIHEHRPETDEEWAAVRRDIIRVVEASNLLLIPGRDVAEPGATSENPEIELQPEQIAELIAEDPDAWVEYAHGLHDAAMTTFDAIERRDVEALLASGEILDQACEACHLNYWYPNDSAARALYEERVRLADEPLPGEDSQ